jgi:hypothetical protein
MENYKKETALKEGPFPFCSGDPNIRKPKIADRAVEVPFHIIRRRGGKRRHPQDI